MKFEILFDNKWLQVRKKTMDNGFEWIYAHSPWSNSTGVAVLGYRDIETEGGFSRREYLGRYELCPAHDVNFELGAITGGMDKVGESPVLVAVRELKEEGGYSALHDEMRFMGHVLNSKSSDYITYLFAVDLTDREQGEIVGDGTLGEEGGYVEWISEFEAVFCNDPLMVTMIQRLKYQK